MPLFYFTSHRQGWSIARAGVGIGVVASLVLTAHPSLAASPGYNGKIAFVSTRDGNDEIYVMNADGSAQSRLTNNAVTDKDPTWSPDGTKIAFLTNRDGNNEIYVMNADGSAPARLTNNAASDGQPAWSPDGTKIAFQSARDGNNEIYVMDADGGNQTRLTTNAVSDSQPSWFPSGQKLVFNSIRTGHTEIYSMNSDGSNQIQVTTHAYSSSATSISPDGTKIADIDGGISMNNEIYQINADGTMPIRLTTSSDSESFASYSPYGTKIVFARITSSVSYIYTMNSDGSAQVPLTTALADGRAPQWQPIPNKAPIATADALSVPVNQAGTVAVLANDTDEETLSGTNLTTSVQPAHGSASIDVSAGKITYTPTTGYSGSDAITYRICDSFLLDQKCATAVLGITVQTPAPTPTVAPTPTPVAPEVSLSSIGTLKTVHGEQTYYYTGHRPAFEGTATPGATITVEIHSEPIILTTVANADGRWSVTSTQDLPNGDHSVTITASKDGVSTTLASYALGINTGLAETGMPMWPLLITAIFGLAALRWRLRRQAA